MKKVGELIMKHFYNNLRLPKKHKKSRTKALPTYPFSLIAAAQKNTELTL